MEHRLRAPPRLVIVKIVFSTSAPVHDSKMRIDAWPTVRSGLAAIVEAGPREAAGEKWPGVVELPPKLRQLRPWRMLQVIRADVALFLVVEIDSASGHGTGGF